MQSRKSPRNYDGRHVELDLGQGIGAKKSKGIVFPYAISFAFSALCFRDTRLTYVNQRFISG